MDGLLIDSEFLYTLKNGGSKYLLGWCMSIGLLASNRICKKCNSPMKLVERKSISDGYEWFCRTKSNENPHAVSLSVRKGSWFEGSRLNLFQILLLTYYWVNGLPNKFILNDMHLSQHTVVSWKSLCRDICIEICMNESCKLGGVNKTVVIYERKLDRKVYSKRNKQQGEFVFVGFERDSTKYFIKVVEKKGKDPLLDIIKSFVLCGTIVVSDCFKTYNCLNEISFKCIAVNKSLHFIDPSDDDHFIKVNETQSVIEQMVPAWLSDDHLNSNFFENFWRRNYSDSNKMMISFLESMKKIYLLKDD